MLNQTQYNTLKAYQVIERDIKLGGVRTVRQLLARTGRANLPYSVFSKLRGQLRAKKESAIPLFLRKQAF
jgi:hypothetical protein